MKKLISVTLFGAALLSVPVQAQSEIALSYEAYADPVSGFSLEVPARWQRQPAENGIFFLGPDGGSDDGSAIGVQVFPRDPAGRLEETAEGVIDTISEGKRGFSLESRAEGPLAGERAILARMTYFLAGEGEYRHDVVVAARTEKLYLLQCMAPRAASSRALQACDRALRSFSFSAAGDWPKGPLSRQDEGWKKVSRKNMEASFEAPASWIVKKDEKNYLWLKDPARGGAGIQVTTKVPAGKVTSLDRVADLTVQSFLGYRAIRNPRLDYRETIPLGGRSARMLVFSYTEPTGAQNRKIMVLALGRKWFHNISFTTSLEQQERTVPLLGKILRSYRFLD